MKHLILIPALLLLPVVGTQAEIVIDATCTIDYEVTEDVRIVDGANPPTIVTIEESASLPDVLVFGSSVVNMTGGNVSSLESHDSSTVKMSGGSGGSLEAYDSSTVNFDGAGYEWVSVNGFSTMNVEGAFGETFHVSDSSTASFSGEFYEFVSVAGSGTMNILGGSFDSVSADSDGTMTISGGDPRNIVARGTSLVTIEGNGFNYPLGEISVNSGTLIGTLADGAPLNARFQVYDGASIVLVPEPSLLVGLLGAIAFGLVTQVGRRRCKA